MFSSAALAERFLADLPDAKTHNRLASGMQKSLILDIEKQGQRFILDPKSPLEGGSWVTFDAKNLDEDNAELTILCDEDQADRKVENGKSIDWGVVAPRDAKRLARVKALYLDGKFSSAADFFHAALVLQHGVSPEDYLLAHEFAVVAIRKGYPNSAAAWLAAASEDRFLQRIGRKQRVGTQLSDPIVVDGCVTDRLRAELSVPSLADGSEQAKAFHPKIEPSLPEATTLARTPATDALVAPESNIGKLSFQEFDQMSGAGWRPLADAGKYHEAAALIVRYMAEVENPKPYLTILNFHAGQCYAMANEIDEAVRRFERSFQEEAPESYEQLAKQWNAYVRGTIAFLKGNRPELERYRNEVAAGPEGPMKSSNVPALDRLIAGFGKGYLEAYAGKSQKTNRPPLRTPTSGMPAAKAPVAPPPGAAGR
jgi:tetratricopeptide (TPR) repeat protein